MIDGDRTLASVQDDCIVESVIGVGYTIWSSE